MNGSYYFEQNIKLVPVLPARPVLPVLWTKESACFTLNYTTISILSMSRPRAATSVATSTPPELFDLKLDKTDYL